MAGVRAFLPLVEHRRLRAGGSCRGRDDLNPSKRGRRAHEPEAPRCLAEAVGRGPLLLGLFRARSRSTLLESMATDRSFSRWPTRAELNAGLAMGTSGSARVARLPDHITTSRFLYLPLGLDLEPAKIRTSRRRESQLGVISEESLAEDTHSERLRRRVAPPSPKRSPKQREERHGPPRDSSKTYLESAVVLVFIESVIFLKRPEKALSPRLGSNPARSTGGARELERKSPPGEARGVRPSFGGTPRTSTRP